MIIECTAHDSLCFFFSSPKVPLNLSLHLSARKWRLSVTTLSLPNYLPEWALQT